MARPLLIPNIDDLARRYAAGESVLQLSRESGIGRGPLAGGLRKAGVQLRGQSDAERLKWERRRLDPAAVERQCGAAWRAARGRRQPLSERIRRAESVHRGLVNRGDHEDALAQAFRDAGCAVAQLLPCGPYNIDIALPELRVAVECVRSNPTTLRRSHKSARVERIEHVLDAGWRLVYVVTGNRAQGLTVRYREVAEHVIAFTNESGRDEATGRQYRVIRGDAQRVETVNL